MIEYFVFCEDVRPMQIADLAAASQDAGWSLRVARNWLAPDGFQLIDDGNLDHDDVTIGWPNDSGLASDFDAALSHGDRKRLDDWIYNYQLGCAMWSIQVPFTFAEHSEFESLDDAREQMGDQYADCLQKTRCMYLVTNCPHMEFTAIAMGAVAILRNGIIEDPQSGSSIPAPEKLSELSTFLKSWPEE